MPLPYSIFQHSDRPKHLKCFFPIHRCTDLSIWDASFLLVDVPTFIRSNIRYTDLNIWNASFLLIDIPTFIRSNIRYTDLNIWDASFLFVDVPT